MGVLRTRVALLFHSWEEDNLNITIAGHEYVAVFSPRSACGQTTQCFTRCALVNAEGCRYLNFTTGVQPCHARIHANQGKLLHWERAPSTDELED